MNRRVSLDQLIQSTTLQPAEAVAIVQQLIHARTATTMTAPFGPPTTATVLVGADGSVSCVSSDTAFAVSELANLLDAMLPGSGTAAVGVPGGLRYTIARARLEVDAPPFDTVEEFSRAVARHERGDRGTVIQRVIARANSVSPDGPLDRRRADPAVAHLRRQLRDADARVYDQQRAIDALSAMTAQPPSRKRGVAVAAAIVIALTGVGAAELIRQRPTPSPTAASAPRVREVPVAPATAPPAPAAIPPRATDRPAPKRTSRIAPSTRDRTPTRPRRFQWLRTRFTFRADPL